MWALFAERGRSRVTGANHACFLRSCAPPSSSRPHLVLAVPAVISLYVPACPPTLPTTRRLLPYGEGIVKQCAKAGCIPRSQPYHPRSRLDLRPYASRSRPPRSPTCPMYPNSSYPLPSSASASLRTTAKCPEHRYWHAVEFEAAARWSPWLVP